MITPRFVAWLKRAKSGRTSLVFEFKVVVVHESGQTDMPPNCHFPNEEQQRTKAVAIEAIKAMAELDFPLNSRLLALTGLTSGWQ
eukprot:2058784-Pleurochrysis_carterae.AAC.1